MRHEIIVRKCIECRWFKFFVVLFSLYDGTFGVTSMFSAPTQQFFN